MSSFSYSPTMRRILLEAFILCVFACAVGLSLNFKLVFNAFSGRAVSGSAVIETMAKIVKSSNTNDNEAFPVPVFLEDLDELLAEGALLVDSRSPEDFRQSHLAGAVSLPLGLLDDQLEVFKQQVPRERTLVTYCSGYGCMDSFELGTRLLKEGFADVMVYEGGFPEWRDAGRPLEKGSE